MNSPILEPLQTRNSRLDLLRGLAISLVVLYHLPGHPVRAGSIGVDLFMVLSGYLVTRQLETLEEGTSPLRSFYRRRIKRILPPVLVVGVVALLLAYCGSDQLRRIRLWDVVSSLGFVANLRFISTNADYFSSATGTPILQHLWSLGVEEQFYIVWPVVLMATPRRFRLALASGLGVTSMIWMSANAESWAPARLYFGTDTRVFALVFGALVALAHNRTTITVRWPRLVWDIGIALVLVAAFLIRPQQTWMFRYGYQAVALVACVLVATAVCMETDFGSTRSNVLNFVGIRSFSIYLVHWPIFTVLTPDNFGGHRYLTAVIQLVVTAAASETLYRLVELPLTRSRRIGQFSFTVLIPLATGTTGVIAVLALLSPGLPTYLQGGTQTSAGTDTSATNRRVLVVGDSVVGSLAPQFSAKSAEHGISITTISMSGCGLLPGMTSGEDGSLYEPSRACEDIVKTELWDKPVLNKFDAIVWLDAWDAEDRVIDGRHLRQDRDIDVFSGLVKMTITRLATFARSVVVAPVPPRASTSTAAPEGPSDYAVRRIDNFAKTTRTVVRDIGSLLVQFIDLPTFVCGRARPCADVSESGQRFRPLDGIHYDGAGAEEVADWILGQLATARIG